MSAVRILRQPIPYARSILWAPTNAPRPVDAAFPVFLRQSALQAIYEHLATLPPPGQGILGFLLGDRCECPVSGVSYSVIDAALRLNQTIYSDRSLDVVTRLWKRLEAQIEAQQAHLIGWYHTHAPLRLELSPHDVETHKQYFSEPWHVAMLVGTDPEAPAGAFFRMGNEAAWARTPQPFYELLNEDSVRPDGKKRSFMTWKTYRAYNPPGLRKSAAHVPPREVDEPQHQAAPEESAPASPPQESAPQELGRNEASVSENMPQAELEEPNRTELEEPPAAAQPAPADAPEAEEDEEGEEEWEDPGALKFLSAADDMPPPPPPRPAAFPSPPPPPVHATPPPAPVVDLASDTGADAPFDQEPAEEQPPEPSAPHPPERRPARRAARRSGRRWRRIFKTGLAAVVVAAGVVAAWQYGPSLVQRVGALIPTHRAAQPAVPASPAAASPAAPPAPAAPRPAPAPRKPEFALLDQADDSLARALQAYDGRVRLFDKRALDCMSLGRGIVRVERAVASYGTQRSATRVPLDSDHVARDRDLRAGVDSASRQFQRSQCAHP